MTRPSPASHHSLARWCIGTLALAVLLLAPHPVRATTVRAVTLDQLVGHAERVVLGRCVEVRESPRGLGALTTTTVTVDVRETLKGPAEERITFTQLTAIGPRFTVGEEVLLFLPRAGRSGLTAPVGLGQGKLVVDRPGGAGSAAVVTPDLAPRAAPVALDPLLATIRARVRGEAR